LLPAKGGFSKTDDWHKERKRDSRSPR